MNIATKRILKDLKDLESNNLEEQGIYYVIDNDNIYNLTYPVIHKNKSIYIPVLEFYKSLEIYNFASNN